MLFYLNIYQLSKIIKIDIFTQFESPIVSCFKCGYLSTIIFAYILYSIFGRPFGLSLNMCLAQTR
jgi:hypothetical protein